MYTFHWKPCIEAIIQQEKSPLHLYVVIDVTFDLIANFLQIDDGMVIYVQEDFSKYLFRQIKNMKMLVIESFRSSMIRHIDTEIPINFNDFDKLFDLLHLFTILYESFVFEMKRNKCRAKKKTCY